MESNCLPVFIVGTGRCGTNLLWDMINLHPGVFVVNETHWISILHDTYGDALIPSEKILYAIENTSFDFTSTPTLEYSIKHHPNLPESSYGDLWTSLRKEILSHQSLLLRDFLDLYFRSLSDWAGANVVGDKTPDYGLRMREIQSMLPGARFIHVRRDGRAVAQSMMKMGGFRFLVHHGLTDISPYLFEDKISELASPYGHSPRATLFKLKSRLGVHRWMANNLPGLSGFYQLWKRREEAVIEQSRALTSGSYLEITCEGLCQEPREVLRSVCDFLNLPVTSEWEKAAVGTIRPR